MGTKEVIFAIALILVIGIALFHTLGHILIFGTGIPRFYPEGSSINISMPKLHIALDTKKLKEEYLSYGDLSRRSLSGEWIVVILMVTTRFVLTKFKGKKAVTLMIQKERNKGSKTKTDLDILYDVLRQRKRLRISDIAKTFRISEEVAMNWGKVLEYGGLAEITYPHIGYPEIKIIEREPSREENEEKK